MQWGCVASHGNSSTLPCTMLVQDYYGRRLATCSSDKTVKVFDVVGEQHVHLADLRGHEGPVWQVAWAHPKFGSLLASCSFDHRVIIWKETQDNQWQQVRSANDELAIYVCTFHRVPARALACRCMNTLSTI